MKSAQPSPFLLAALHAWGLEPADLERVISTGLINETYEVRMNAQPMILQRVHPVFSPQIHQNIRAVSDHLRSKGMLSPQLVPNHAGLDVFQDDEGRCWRMQDYVAGTTVEKITSADQAHRTAHYLGKWHDSLSDINHHFVGMRSGVHDTDAHKAVLNKALEQHASHSLFSAVQEVAHKVLEVLDTLPELPELMLTVAHGDPKIANLRFDVDKKTPKAWIDLDTVGPMRFAHEIGDAIRSWCNQGLEDAAQAQVRLDWFSAALEGYQDAIRGLSAAQKQGFVWGPAWIASELSLRFAADALNESYFGWDSERYSSAGEHHLARAKGQLALAVEFVASADHRK